MCGRVNVRMCACDNEDVCIIVLEYVRTSVHVCMCVYICVCVCVWVLLCASVFMGT